MTDSKTILLKILLMMSQPLARLCLKHAIGVQQAIEALKKAFIDCAAQSIQKAGHKVNVSRLSIATGLHRRDVIRLIEQDGHTEQAMHPLSRIIAAWETLPEYITKQGKARVLKHEGNNSEFNLLVRSVTSDLHPGTVLFQLEQMGAVEKTTHGIKLLSASENIKNDPLKAYQLLSKDMQDLPQVVEDNMIGDRALPHLHARTEYDNILAKALPKIEAWLLQEGSLFHQKARNFISQFDQDLYPQKLGKAQCRVALITFSLSRQPKSELSLEKELYE
jgi:hypothetical protein